MGLGASFLILLNGGGGILRGGGTELRQVGLWSATGWGYTSFSALYTAGGATKDEKAGRSVPPPTLTRPRSPNVPQDTPPTVQHDQKWCSRTSF